MTEKRTRMLCKLAPGDSIEIGLDVVVKIKGDRAVVLVIEAPESVKLRPIHEQREE